MTRINTNFPHWFDGEFKRFNGREDHLPFDQNGLVGLCAPQPVLFSCGEQDVWADPPGELDVLRAGGIGRIDYSDWKEFPTGPSPNPVSFLAHRSAITSATRRIS